MAVHKTPVAMCVNCNGWGVHLRHFNPEEPGLKDAVFYECGWCAGSGLVAFDEVAPAGERGVSFRAHYRFTPAAGTPMVVDPHIDELVAARIHPAMTESAVKEFQRRLSMLASRGGHSLIGPVDGERVQP